MSFSIKATIRAWWVPEHRVSCRGGFWHQIVADLERRGGHRHEAGVFLLGLEQGGHRVVTEVVFYDELDPNAYTTGVCVLQAGAFAKLWALCRQKQLMVVADVHTHPGVARQSPSDKANPMVATAGHIAIIVPNFARSPAENLGVYEYRGQHEWTNHSGLIATKIFYTGFWS